ncbi:unnamed protein product [Caenorhabditis auriculariae]|uniref:Uncharacterized protein n=1 Tax=Caenorhabditis auriculariae TaxID=2777116 RepID=A0A8S1GMI6_9PELO|nr:unnamed protein product [Caenorhabditis auriculariae]
MTIPHSHCDMKRICGHPPEGGRRMEGPTAESFRELSQIDGRRSRRASLRCTSPATGDSEQYKAAIDGAECTRYCGYFSLGLPWIVAWQIATRTVFSRISSPTTTSWFGRSVATARPSSSLSSSNSANFLMS